MLCKKTRLNVFLNHLGSFVLVFYNFIRLLFPSAYRPHTI